MIARSGGVGAGGGSVIRPKVKHSKPLSGADIPCLIKALDCYGGWLMYPSLITTVGFC